MFESFHSARRRTALHRAAPWILAGLVVHGALVVAAWISSLWEIEKLEAPRMQIRLAGAIGAPPPPPPAGAAAPAALPVAPRKKRVTERVQPVPPARVVPPAPVPVPEVHAAVAPTELENVAGEAGDECIPKIHIGCKELPTEVMVRASQAAGPTPLGRYDKLVIDAPDEASHGRRGAIVVVLQIDTHGRVERVELAEGMDDALDTQAMQLALKFRFRPARDDGGVAIPSRVSWTFHVYPTTKTS